ncbi:MULTISPECIES: PaaI family thioesterase [Nocardioides]|uniref:Acyl-coenzyme A thioesterase THEM4 n=1 Tax=Nocardioides vastitatis TaxID=2568655 RepID=A0ABW0ZK76_9ACTN|nr:PaaI family thioesterase [Nocardioides sp.]THI96904.1 PaaI family thioesterase [Nocardioides sp.]
MTMEMFILDETSTGEVDRREKVVAALTDSVRDLVDATIRSTVDDDEILAVREEVDALVSRLRAAQLAGPAGVRYNAEGRSWNWGNAVVGQHNALAPPLEIVHDGPGSARADVVLGAAYEGPPGMVHGGVAALLLDQIMGETASGFKRLTMTGTLSLRYRRGTPLGPVRIEGRIASESGRKITVQAHLAGPDGEPTVEATGLFIIPSWAPVDESDRTWARFAEG